MPTLVIACYRPRPGQDAALLSLVREHVPTLRRLGLASAREVLVLRAADGTLLELFEWASEEAVERAHHDETVRALWGRFEQVCEWVSLDQLAESRQPFSHFTPVSL